MPETFRDSINRILRDHQGYTGDGQGGVGDLPIGDRSTARKPIEKRDLRTAFLDFADVADDAQAAADNAAINAGSVIDRAWFPTVSSLTGDNSTIIGYAGAGAQFTVAVGDLIEAGGFRYQVSAEDADTRENDAASGYDVETAGGVKLRAISPDADAYGPSGDGVDDDTAVFSVIEAAGGAVLGREKSFYPIRRAVGRLGGLRAVPWRHQWRGPRPCYLSILMAAGVPT